MVWIRALILVHNDYYTISKLGWDSDLPLKKWKKRFEVKNISEL